MKEVIEKERQKQESSTRQDNDFTPTPKLKVNLRDIFVFVMKGCDNFSMEIDRWLDPNYISSVIEKISHFLASLEMFKKWHN